MGFLAGILMIDVIGVQAAGDLDSGLGWLIFAAVLFFSITVHELGHLSAGWLMKFHFSSISVGPISLRMEHGRLKVALLREMTALGYAGMHIDRVWHLRTRLLFYTLSGPVAPLLLVPLAVWFANRSTFAHSHPWAVSFAAEFVMLSLILSMISLVPMGRVSINDGSRLAMLIGDVQGTRRLICISAILLRHEKGVRPRDWKRTWLNAGSSISDESALDFGANWLSYVSCLDREDDQGAGTHLEECLETSRLFGDGIRDLVAQESAVFSAWRRRDGLLADKWLTQVKRPKLIQPLQRIRINVALSSARGEVRSALEEWQRGLEYIEKLPVSRGRRSLMDSWLEWRDKIEGRQTELTTA